MPRLGLCTGAGRVFHKPKSLSIFVGDGSQPWNLQADFTSVNVVGLKSSSVDAVIAVRFIVLVIAPKQPAVKRCGHQAGAINRVQKDALNMPDGPAVTGSAEIK
jgi:hypothetical protein